VRSGAKKRTARADCRGKKRIFPNALLKNAKMYYTISISVSFLWQAAGLPANRGIFTF
jgi:hypothetical protein